MTNLPLTIISQNSLKVTVGWTPPANVIGYRFFRDAKPVSSSWDATKTQVTFGIPDAAQHTFAVVAVTGVGQGTVTVNGPAPPPPPASSVPNALGPFSVKAPDWNDPTKWRADSAKLIAALAAADTTGSSLTVSGYGVAFYVAKVTDPVASVRNTRGWGTATGTTSFRCPAGVKPAAGSDAHMAVQQPDLTIVEMWETAGSGVLWSAGAVSVAQPAQFTYMIAGCRGSSLTLMSGVVTPDEVKAGAINHVVAMTLPSAAVARAFVPPSNATDGVNTTGIPEGARLVLDPGYDLSGLAGVAKTVAQALKTYGGIVVDKDTSDVTVLAQAPESWTSIGQPDPWAAQGLSGYPDLKLLALIPHMRIAA